MVHMALSDKSFEFTSMISEAYVKENEPVGLVPVDFSSPYFSPSLVSANLPLEFQNQSKSTDMQNQNQDNCTPDFWTWNNQDPKEMICLNLDLDTSAFDFPVIDTSYSPQDHVSWSASSSPISSSSKIPQPSTSQEPSSPAASSFHSSSMNGQPRKSKAATKGERLEKRREKNRTSQRRYRERKEKYIQDLENQCKRLQERYDNLYARLIPEDGMQKCEEKAQWEWPEEGQGDLEGFDLNRASGSVEID
ncbi:hypothetical protein BJ875DRAFT_452372 [Amylocarpus encephaloides]|uniref:BZIP domain-containing protein n=1 Tax=Amylocarpus encephaloides TaxID=45428 RepID=A0A9P8C933_9HELO|nr:hypothetical protein BJ875DRAFT_452372 [Amylocarpus encephaloides]